VSDPSVYVHVPFCETKCPYCDFNSFAVAGRDVDGYLDALEMEMEARGVPADPPTVFIGGGTPTVVEPEQLERYVGALMSRFAKNGGREVTVEANPGSLTAEKIELLLRQGINRVSLGAQSLYDRHLRTLGRVHSASQVREAFDMLRAAGLDNVNLDLIYAVPGLTRREWASTLDRVVTWGPDHLACYSLTYEPGTEFFAWRKAGRLRPLAEREELAMFRFTERRLRAAGIERYEVSNFARPGKECRHNLTYWRNESYVGYGAGAHSYLGGRRLGNARHLGRYAEAVAAKGHAIVQEESLSGLDGAREMLVLGLRTSEGVSLDEIGARFGIDAQAAFRGQIDQLAGAGYVRSGERLRLARRGWRVADEVAVALLAEA
jgi:oxygen-independent coproporphyrinogen-3 oxidase